MQRILVAGATGTLGRSLVGALHERGYAVRAIGRDPAALGRLPTPETVRADLTLPATLAGVCEGVDAVISCAGASMALDGLRDRRTFGAVDHAGNANLLREALRAGVGKMVYVSLFGAERLLDTEYARAHERFVTELGGSGLPHAVVRPTGFFSFLGELVRMAGRGRGVVVGSGEARLNPIHEADVAAVCAEALATDAPDLPVGGPETFTRRELVELAFEAVGRAPRIASVPGWLLLAAAAPLRVVNPRLHALVHFGARVSGMDVVAPAVGTRDLASYFRALARPAGEATAGAATRGSSG